MKKKDKIINKISDKTEKLNRIDYIIIAIMITIYGIISFYNLGETKVPNTYYTFKNNGDSIIVNLNKEIDIGKILYYTGNNTGEIELYASNDEKNFTKITKFTTNSVFAFEELNVYTKAKYLKFISNSENITIGDIAIINKAGTRVSLKEDKQNPLLDETNLVKEKSYLNSTYFDEIYYARTAYEYVNGINIYEWTHPPLGKLIMAIPIYLFGFSPFTFRLMGNIAGILLIPVMYILAKKIFKDRKYALLGGLIMMFDNFHFVHTRIALIDGFELLFILLSVIFMKNYLDLTKPDSIKKKRNNLLLSGLFFGCSISVKWNAIYAGIGLFLVFITHLLKENNINIIDYCKNNKIKNIETIIKGLMIIFIGIAIKYLSLLFINEKASEILLNSYILILIAIAFLDFIIFLTKDKQLLKLFITCIISFIIIPLIIYTLCFVLFPIGNYSNTLEGLINQNKAMYDYHHNLNATHPFTSKWYQWPIMYKPVWFYSSGTTNSMKSTIVDIGNPFIWWFGIISSIYLLISSIKKKDSNNIFILTFILSTFLPYIFIGRIMFMYHYFITLPFVMLGIVSLTKYITEKLKNNKFYISYIIVIITTFIIFYPIVSGMEIDENYINSLKWLSSWIF